MNQRYTRCTDDIINLNEETVPQIVSSADMFTISVQDYVTKSKEVM